jgi:hypothetical protein
MSLSAKMMALLKQEGDFSVDFEMLVQLQRLRASVANYVSQTDDGAYGTPDITRQMLSKECLGMIRVVDEFLDFYKRNKLKSKRYQTLFKKTKVYKSQVEELQTSLESYNTRIRLLLE